MSFDKTTWIGLIIAAFGWTMMVSTPQLSAYWANGGKPAVAVSLEIARIAQCTILSGFGIAILGALQTGFAILKKALESRLEPGLPRELKLSAHNAARPRKIVERGWVKNRAYILFDDGSVEVETMLGRRLFGSLDEAQQFIA
jgi:hypothetical protein